MKNDVLKFTPEQRLAAQETGRSVAVMAGAGSGKTAVLIERIKNIVLGGKARLNDIVAITFTEKAAGEMTYRLMRDLPARHKAELDLALITTIDGFCTKILREDAATVGIDPDFRILEEHASRILNHRIISNTLKELLREGTSDAERIVDELEFKYAVACLEALEEERWQYLRTSPSPSPQRRLLPKSCHSCESRNPGHLNSLDPCLRRDDRRGDYFGNTLRRCEGDNREDGLERALANIFRIANRSIAAEKKGIGAIDFVDLEIRTLEILSENEDIRNKHQLRIKHLLIDEYQDTSELQTEIIKKIYNPRRNIVCIVGDPGQSIYRFRGAYPEGIHEMRKCIEKDGGLSVDLTANFRSGAPVIQFINDVFGGGDARENRFLPLTANAGRCQGSKVAKMEFGAENLNANEAREAEAEAIARLISSGGFSLRDIAILFRSFTNIRIYEQALQRFGIPFYRSGGRTFLSQPEVSDIILCLKVLNDPENDTLAYGLLRSAIIGLSDEESYRLMAGRGTGLFNIVTADKRFGFMKDFIGAKKYLDTTGLIRKIIESSNLYHTYETLTGSGQATANIEKLILLSKTLNREYDYTLEEFLDYIDDLKVRRIGIGEPPIFSPHDDAVKLLTVHAAKGLEFGVVILADLARCDRRYNLPYIADSGKKIGFKLREGENPIAPKESTAAFTEILDSETAKDRLEQERLLYVAASRAKEMLILSIPAGKKTASVWFDKIAPKIDSLEAVAEGTTKPVIPAEAGIQSTSSHWIPAFAGMTSPHQQPPTGRGDKARCNITLTVSQLESYYRCPQEYYLKYIARLPADRPIRKSEGITANVTGSIVHRVILLESSLHNAGIDELILAAGRDILHTDPSKGDLRKIRRYIDNYLSGTYYRTRLTDPKYETPFVLRLGETLIRGTIDCVFADGSGCTIVDFKTDAIGDTAGLGQKAGTYRLQMMTYAIAVKKAFRKDVSKVSLLFLDKGYASETAITAGDIDGWTKKIEETAESIRLRLFDLPRPQKGCKTCLYRRICA